MGFSAAAHTGREAARVTNTRYRLRTITEFRATDRAPYPGSNYAPKKFELIGECGHAVLVSLTGGNRETWESKVGSRKRCPHCPIQ